MKTHPLNVSYLVIGLVFLAISGAWALRQAGVIDTADVTWLGPVALIVAGGVGLVAAVARGMRRGGEPPEYAPDYQQTYDPPLPQDYTSDIDRKLDAARTTVIPAAGTRLRDDTARGTEPSDDAEADTAVIRTTEQDDPKEENR
jgi:hypothetical protein